MAGLLGRLGVDFFLDPKNFTAGLNQAQQKMNSAQSSMNRSIASIEKSFRGLNTVLGAFGVSLGALALVQFAKRSLDAVGNLGELAEQLGISTDALQVYQYAATQAGLKTEELENAIGKFTRTIGEAADGNKAALDAFNKLDVGILDAQGNLRSTESVLLDVADGLARIEDPAQRAAVVVDLFGRAGQKLLPFLSGGAEGIRRFTQEAKAAGAVISGDLIADADKTADKLAALNTQFSRMAQLGAALGSGPLLNFMEKLNLFLEDFRPSDAKSLAAINEEIAETTRLLDEAQAKQGNRLGGDIFGAETAGAKRIADYKYKLQDLFNLRDRLAGQGLFEPPKPGAAAPTSNRNPQDKEQTDAIKAATAALERKVAAQRAEADTFGLSESAKAEAMATEETLATLRSKGVKGLNEEQRALIASLGVQIRRTEQLKLEEQILKDSIEASVEQTNALWESTTAEANRQAKVFLTQKAMQEEVSLLEEQSDAALESKVAFDEVTKTYYVYDRALQIVLRTQSLMQENLALTREEAQQMATDYVDAADRLRKATEGVSEQARRANEDARELANVAGNNLADALLDAGTGADVAQVALREFQRALLNIVVIRPLVDQLTGSLQAMFSASGSGGGIGGLLSGLFGGAGAGSSSGTSTASLSELSYLGNAAGNFATGTDSAPPGLAWVGERGRELVMMNGGERVMRGDQIAGMGGGGTYYIDARGADKDGLRRLEQTIRELDGSVDRRAVSAARTDRQRNPSAWR
jgi:hypothetical protein